MRVGNVLICSTTNRSNNTQQFKAVTALSKNFAIALLCLSNLHPAQRQVRTNSSDVHFIDKVQIWSTSGATMGQEEPFPGPDNPSKMRRSVENAEHVGKYMICPDIDPLLSASIGLFAPRAGQNFRDEQRRRRSQYDRGTRFADIEDSYGPRAYQCHGSPTVIDGPLCSESNYQQQIRQMYYSRFPGSC